MECRPIIAGKFAEAVIPLIEKAKNNIDICVFDWRWYPADPGAPCQKFNTAIINAINRGVKVRAIVNSQNIVDILKKAGAEVKKHYSAHLLHTKMMLIDERQIITGSHNYTQSAFSANYEFSVALDDLECWREIQQFFNHLWVR